MLRRLVRAVLLARLLGWGLGACSTDDGGTAAPDGPAAAASADATGGVRSPAPTAEPEPVVIDEAVLGRFEQGQVLDAAATSCRSPITTASRQASDAAASVSGRTWDGL